MYYRNLLLLISLSIFNAYSQPLVLPIATYFYNSDDSIRIELDSSLYRAQWDAEKKSFKDIPVNMTVRSNKDNDFSITLNDQTAYCTNILNGDDEINIIPITKLYYDGEEMIAGSPINNQSLAEDGVDGFISQKPVTIKFNSFDELFSDPAEYSNKLCQGIFQLQVQQEL